MFIDLGIFGCETRLVNYIRLDVIGTMVLITRMQHATLFILFVYSRMILYDKKIVPPVTSVSKLGYLLLRF